MSEFILPVGLDAGESDYAPDGFALRLLDVSIAVLAALVLFPVMVLIGLGVWMQDRGPIFFGHVRIGRNGQAFRCWKFRSMCMDSSRVLAEHLASDPVARAEWELSHKLRNDPRITPLGLILRKLSLDELPQLWNVLTGEMSLVGPRPIVPEEAKRYGDAFAAYCYCRPGITGLWQISGRNDISYDSRVALDVQYARTRSMWLNLAIILRTVPAVVLRKGSY
jgi:exopolysaccharide production protein ExoY